jgi:membrane protease YdiL (CAAX protease family)
MGESTENDRRWVVVFGVLLEAALGGVAVLWGIWSGHPAGSTLRAEPQALIWGVAATGPLLLVFFWSVRSRLKPLAQIRRFFAETLQPLVAQCTLPELALISVAAGVGEELLFRGVIQASATRSLGLWPGIIVGNAVFGLLHAITPAYVVIAALMGAYLGLLWVATGNLLAPITAHALYDFVALAYMLRNPLVVNRAESSSDAPE